MVTSTTVKYTNFTVKMGLSLTTLTKLSGYYVSTILYNPLCVAHLYSSLQLLLVYKSVLHQAVAFNI